MTEELMARHTGNAGIVIYGKARRPSASMCFCRDRKGLYEDTPKEERRLLLTAIESRELKTLVFTHEHGDHFCLEDVLEALRRNPELRIISTGEVIRRIREQEESLGVLTAVSPEETGFVEAGLLEPGMKLKLFNSPHMGEQFADVQNLVCLLEAGGKRLLLPGDARPDGELFSRTALWSPVIDWMIAPFPLLGLPSSRKKIAASLTLRHVLAVHLPRPEKDAHGWRESAVKVCERAKDGLPMPIFAGQPGKTYVI